MTQMNLSWEQKQSGAWRIDWWLPSGRGRRGFDWEFEISRCKLVYIEWINNKVLLCSTGSYIQYPVVNHSGKEYEKECIYVCN